MTYAPPSAMQQSIMTLALTWDYSKHLVCKQCTFCIAFGVLDLDIIYITRAAGVSKKVLQTHRHTTHTHAHPAHIHTTFLICYTANPSALAPVHTQKTENTNAYVAHRSPPQWRHAALNNGREMLDIQ